MAKKKAAETKAKKAEAPAQRARKKRQIYTEGHKRKFLVVVDETPECESALAFAASRAQRTAGQLALLYVIEPGTDIWLGVEEVAREEGLNKAKAVFRLFGRKLKAMGFEELVPEEIVREGMDLAVDAARDPRQPRTPTVKVIAPSLIVRQSTAPPRKA